jgi:hypothetical protein
VSSGRFPEKRHLISMEDTEFKEAIASIEAKS